MPDYEKLTTEQILQGMEREEANRAKRKLSVERIQDFVGRYVTVDDKEIVNISTPTEGAELPNYEELRKDIFLTVTMGEIEEHVPMVVVIAVAMFVSNNTTPRTSL